MFDFEYDAEDRAAYEWDAYGHSFKNYARIEAMIDRVLDKADEEEK